MEQLDMLTITRVYVALMRYIAPGMTLVLLLRCGLPLLTFPREPEIWAWLVRADGIRMPITHWENLIGRGKHCDVVIPEPEVSRNHAVLTRYDDGSWTISDAESKGGVSVNGKKVQICAVHSRSRIEIGGVEMRLRQLGRRLSIPRVHPHKFRRTLATSAIDKGMPIEQVQQLLGHQKIDTTMHYAMVKQQNVKLAHRKYIG